MAICWAPRWRSCRLAVLAAQALEQRHRALWLRRPCELAHARQAHDLAGGHAADHGVALVAARLQGRQHRLDVVLHEQHGGDDDVAWAMSSRQRSRADGSEPQLAVACMATCTPGASRRIFVAARCTLSVT
jgi:hypothetical protein